MSNSSKQQDRTRDRSHDKQTQELRIDWMTAIRPTDADREALRRVKDHKLDIERVHETLEVLHQVLREKGALQERPIAFGEPFTLRETPANKDPASDT